MKRKCEQLKEKKNRGKMAMLRLVGQEKCRERNYKKGQEDEAEGWKQRPKKKRKMWMKDERQTNEKKKKKKHIFLFLFFKG